MGFERVGHRPLDYRPVTYDGSKLVFRGPQRRLTGDFVACLGGTETYGTFIDRPYPDLMERSLALPCVNFGWPNAGVDAFLKDEGLLDIVSRARAVVLQVPGAMNLSNPYYRVHPRRNDRFLEATQRLRRLYPEVDFTEFHFTRHMMRRLEDVSPDRFAVLREGLQEAWVTAMQTLLERIAAPVVLMWFSRHLPGLGHEAAGVADDPAFVSRAMLRAVGARAAQVVEVVISPEACAQGTRGMRFDPMQEAVAADLPGLLAHSEAARALSPVLEALNAE
ncbi:hypothetical protein rosmuc_02561 [Roseovarius mucosus DSM 17069]|uniref:DUF6473 domain-containing protein n=1 Tax=Roseovarius mucosus DSM 17069 TaxID=1288298 RepID=A0A0A0HNY0_9RHOB|nr:DUF6473 family protein [Roseovarius mucosus]KGM87823.1 hypothetical protein rosmuc_02561 [Roseovarius mucosus DSM 17069]